MGDGDRVELGRMGVGDGCGQDGHPELYGPNAVLAFPPGQETAGRDAIRVVCEQMLAQRPHFELEEALPTVRNGDLALTSTRPSDDTGGRVQVARRQADGTWLRVIDRPEVRG